MHPRARAKRESHEISESLRRIGWGTDDLVRNTPVCRSKRRKNVRGEMAGAMLLVSRLIRVEFPGFHVF